MPVPLRTWTNIFDREFEIKIRGIPRTFFRPNAEAQGTGNALCRASWALFAPSHHAAASGLLEEGAPLIVVQGLHPALKKLGLPKAGMHAFRRGSNRRWELARISAAVIRQQMGHASARMTAHYTGEIPVEVVKNFLQLDSNGAAKAA
jgi:hypothetical protein